MLRAIIIFAALLFGSTMAEAQPTPLNGQGLVYNSFTPYSGTNVITLSLSAATSANAALGITSPVNTPSVAWVQNTGSNPANVILGVGNTLTASLTTGTYLGAGTCIALNSIGTTYIAGYSTAGTTLTVTMGVGNPAGSCGGAGSGGGGGLSVAFGGPIGANGTPVGFKDGSGNFQPLLGDTTNGQWVNVKAAVGLAQGSTTSGQTGSLIMCAGVNAQPTAVTNGQTTAAQCGLNGEQIVRPWTVKENQAGGSATTTGNTATTIIAAGTGSNKTYVTDWECWNSSAVTVTVTFNDSHSTQILVPAGSGNSKSLQSPLATAAATAFTYTSSASETTVGCAAQGFYAL